MEQPLQNTDRNHTSRAAVVSRSLFVEDDNGNDDNPQEHLQCEEQVLADAMLAMLNNFMNLSTDVITSGFVYSFETLTPYIMGSGAFMTTAAAGMEELSVLTSSSRCDLTIVLQSTKPWSHGTANYFDGEGRHHDYFELAHFCSGDSKPGLWTLGWFKIGPVPEYFRNVWTLPFHKSFQEMCAPLKPRSMKERMY